jgi:hypothetical protein
MTFEDAQRTVLRQIEQGPNCMCGHARSDHADHDGALVRGYDGDCQKCTECKSYRPVGISYHQLVEGEVAEQVEALHRPLA